MSKIKGRELGTVIHPEASFLSFLIVFLSTESHPDKQLVLIKIGADKFLTKPISPERLIASL